MGVDFHRAGNAHPLMPTTTRYCPIIDANQWKGNLIPPLPDTDDGPATEPIPTPVSAHVIVGCAFGAIAGSIIYGGTGQRIRPYGIPHEFPFLRFAESAPYPSVSAASAIALGKTPEIADLSTEPEVIAGLR